MKYIDAIARAAGKFMFSTRAPGTFFPPPPPEFLAKSRSSPEFAMNSGFTLKLILLALVFLLLPAGTAFAATITVNVGVGETDTASTCSFDEAWLQARHNEDKAGSGCVATDLPYGDDTIILTKDVAGGAKSMPNAATGANRSLGSIILEGRGHTFTMTTRFDRHFTVNRAHLTINNLIMTKDTDRGAASRGGAIHLTRSVTGGGGLTVNDSVFHGFDDGQDGVVFVGQGHATINRSVFYNNSLLSGRGSAIYLDANGSVAVNNSVFYNNTGGYVIEVGTRKVAKDLTLRHSTIFNNKRGGGIGLTHTSELRNVTIQNNIVYDNSSAQCANEGNCACNLDGTLTGTKTITGNIFGGGANAACNPDAQLSVDPLLTDPGNVKSYLPLSAGSPAIDAAPTCAGQTRDVRRVSRPQGSACDIGAYEYVPPPAPPAAEDDEEAGEAGEGGIYIPPATPIATSTPAAPSCLTLPGHISVRNITHSTQCTRVDAAGIGNAQVLALGFRDGVDVWGWVLPNMQICFEGNSGSFRFLDAATAPRAVSELPAMSIDGMICTTINRAGTVAFVNGPPAPAATAILPAYQSLSGCMVTLQYALNFRDAPAGDIIDVLPSQVRLTALERTDGWFKVDYHGEQGWIAAEYVAPEGNCG